MRPYLPPAAFAVVLVVGRIWLAGAGTVPDGQPLLAVLTTESLKTDFNAARATMRAIALLSPSCPYCLRGASDIQRALASHPQRSLTLFVVWQPILPTDWGQPRTAVLHRLRDTRVRQFWDSNRTAAEVFRRSFDQRESQPSCCYHREVWWDMIAVFPAGAEWQETLPEPLLLDGTVADAASAFDALLSK